MQPLYFVITNKFVHYNNIIWNSQIWVQSLQNHMPWNPQFFCILCDLLELHSVATLRVSVILKYRYMEHKTFFIPTLKPLRELQLGCSYCLFSRYPLHAKTYMKKSLHYSNVLQFRGRGGSLFSVLTVVPPPSVIHLSNWISVTALGIAIPWSLCPILQPDTTYVMVTWYSVSHKYCSSYIPLFCLHCYSQVINNSSLCLWISV
jgi:hypothetical protein